MKTAVVSSAFGSLHERIAELTFPSQQRYAKAIGADFVRLTRRKFPHRRPHVEKFQLYDVLESYDAALWIDCDALVSRYACSIFDHVPTDHFAAVDEAKVRTLVRVDQEIAVVSKYLGLPVPATRPFIYFNSGVFVAWKCHRDIFRDIPDKVPSVLGFNDQTIINVRVAHAKFKFKSLHKTWNMIWVPVGFERSHIVHFAGRRKEDSLLDDVRRHATSAPFA